MSDSLVELAFLATSMSFRTTWSRKVRLSPSASAFTMSPSSRTWNVRGSPSVSR